MGTNVNDQVEAADCLASVLPLETNKQNAPDFNGSDDDAPRWAQTAAQRRLHAHWNDERSAVIDAMLNGPLALTKRAVRLEGCCSHPSAVLKKNGTIGLVLYACRDRMCPRCQVARGQRASRRIESIVLAMNAPRKIELTVKHRVAPLAEQADRLYRCFKELRRSKVWRRYCKGGVAVFEITINPKDRLWHPHLHIVFDGEFFPQKLLAEEWHRITTDSTYAYIKPVPDRKRAAKYLGDYLAKPCSFDEMSASEIREFATALHGRRVVMTFGTSHAANPDPKPEPYMSAEDESLISLHRLTAAAERGHERARTAVDLLRSMSPVWCSALGFLPFRSEQPAPIVTLDDQKFIAEVCVEVREADAAAHASLRSDDGCCIRTVDDAAQLALADFSQPPPQSQAYR